MTGLLGHNGAGKSTALALCAGFADPSTGTVRVLGHDPRREPEVYRRIGIVHDRDGLWPFLTARELVELMAGLRDVPDPPRAAPRRSRASGLEDAAERRVGGFSKGMRQRVKLAQALVHSPELLLLDEPLNGLDPVQRRHVVELIRRLGAEGRTVLVSSHVLHEVERMAPRVVVLVNGRLVAEGETGAIRDLIRDRPRTLRIAAGRRRRRSHASWSARASRAACASTTALVVETADMDALGRRLMPLARDLGATLDRVEPLGDDLESVYTYLTDHARGRGR